MIICMHLFCCILGIIENEGMTSLVFQDLNDHQNQKGENEWINKCRKNFWETVGARRSCDFSIFYPIKRITCRQGYKCVSVCLRRTKTFTNLWSVSHLPVMFELLSGPEQLLDVLGHLLSFQYDILCAGQGGIRLPRLPTSSLLRLPTAFLLTAAAHTDEKST